MRNYYGFIIFINVTEKINAAADDERRGERIYVQYDVIDVISLTSAHHVSK